jgi:S1-C subfamily serine protease
MRLGPVLRIAPRIGVLLGLVWVASPVRVASADPLIVDMSAPTAPLGTAPVGGAVHPEGVAAASGAASLAGRPPMPAAADGPALSPGDLYLRAAPSVYVVKAIDEHRTRTVYSQGGAVAIDNHILLTNCHVVFGHQRITLFQHGVAGRAVLISADRASDRCVIRSEDMEVHPIGGVRRFADLKVGEKVFSLGAPMGAEQSFRQGTVSAVRRLDSVEIIQNSARTWFGSSGGGLFDSYGNLVGITTAIDINVASRNFSIAAEEFW